MGHKGPVLRPRCIGPGRARTQILFYFILFYSVLFCSILVYSILFYSVQFYSILFYSILFYSILFCSILFFYILFYSILFYSVLFYSMLFYSILFFSFLFYSILLTGLYNQCASPSVLSNFITTYFPEEKTPSSRHFVSIYRMSLLSRLLTGRIYHIGSRHPP